MPTCKACDAPLTDFEATRRYYDSDVYLDLCNLCFAPIAQQVHVVERYDLFSDADRIEIDEDTPDEYLEWEFFDEDTNGPEQVE